MKKPPLRFAILGQRYSSSQYVAVVIRCHSLFRLQGHPTQFCLGACVAQRPAACTASRNFLEVGEGLTVPSPQHAGARAKARNKTAA